MRHDHPMDRLHAHLDELVAAHEGIDQAASDHAERHHARRIEEVERQLSEATRAMGTQVRRG